MKVKFINKRIDYDGSQLVSHWIYKNFKIVGDSLVGFIGRCDINFENMVDLEDLQKREKIYSEEMLHFIGEFFEKDLQKTILLQRLFAEIVKEEIETRTKLKILRCGNDLYEKNRKITISVATLSPVSSLFHFGINIISKNTPVLSKGLSDYGIQTLDFAKTVLRKFQEEIEDIKNSLCKVRWVK